MPLQEKAILIPDEVWRAQLKVVALHAALEEREDVAVVGVGCERQPTAVVHELLELGRLVQAELIDGHLLLLALDVIIFFVLRASWEALPRKRSAQEVEQHVANRLQVVPAGLLVTDVRADGGVPGRASQVLSFAEGDVLALGVLVALGETEVNDVNVVFSALIPANKEVVWLDIAMDNPLLMHFLNTVDLRSAHDNTQNNELRSSEGGQTSRQTVSQDQPVGKGLNGLKYCRLTIWTEIWSTVLRSNLRRHS